jgi:hypothetical protein
VPGRIITLSSVISASSSKVSLSIPSTCLPSTSLANSRIATAGRLVVMARVSVVVRRMLVVVVFWPS